MKRLGREDIGVRIPGDDGYIGTLNVYHELHCLVSQNDAHFQYISYVANTLQKRLHQYMYQDIYWKDLDDNQREMNRLHNGEQP
jgi:hypothetical protein